MLEYIEHARPWLVAVILLGGVLHTYLYMGAERGSEIAINSMVPFPMFQLAWHSAQRVDVDPKTAETGFGFKGPSVRRLPGSRASHGLNVVCIAAIIALSSMLGWVLPLAYLLIIVPARAVVEVLTWSRQLDFVAHFVFTAHWFTAPVCASLLWLPFFVK